MWVVIVRLIQTPEILHAKCPCVGAGSKMRTVQSDLYTLLLSSNLHWCKWPKIGHQKVMSVSTAMAGLTPLPPYCCTIKMLCRKSPVWTNPERRDNCEPHPYSSGPQILVLILLLICENPMSFHAIFCSLALNFSSQGIFQYLCINEAALICCICVYSIQKWQSAMQMDAQNLTVEKELRERTSF